MCIRFECSYRKKCDKYREESYTECLKCSVNGDCEECEYSEDRGDGILICTWWADKLLGDD